MDKYIENSMALAGPSPGITTRFRRAANLADCIIKSVNLTPFVPGVGFANVLDLVYDVGDYMQESKALCVYVTVLFSIFLKFNAALAAGIQFKLLDTTALELLVQARLLKISIACNSTDLAIITSIENIEHQRVSSAQLDAKRQNTGTHSSGNSSGQAGLTAGIMQQGVGSFVPAILDFCFDFNRPGGCTRKQCSKPHLIVKCPRFPGNCTFGANCRFHHG